MNLVDEVISEEQQQIASNACDLLNNWRTPPGKINDSEFNGQYFIEWLDQVVKICDDSGHLDIALSTVGNVLIYVPADDDHYG